MGNVTIYYIKQKMKGMKKVAGYEEMKVQSIPLELLHAGSEQPRKIFDEDELRDLSRSITVHGIIQPLTVKKDGRGYEVIAGERRMRAAGIAGLTHVPCIVIEADKETAALLSLIENLQRSDLTIFEEARGIDRLIKIYGLTQQEAAQRLGKKQSSVANKLRLLKLEEDERELIIKNRLGERHARALLPLESKKLRLLALSKIIKGRLSAAQSEALVKKMLEVKELPPKRVLLFKDIRLFVNTINHAVSVMHTSGIDAKAVRTEYEDRLEYNIVIPKPQLR